ncbi:MAG: hypothetical protein PWQ08_822 [Clostridiales bacterium]|jgi:nicotinamidase-related amidase|nr:hypothetical protein [Clostridiales bacterium]
MEHAAYGALMIVDMQTALVAGHPWHETPVVQNIHALLQSCRKAGIPIIYVRHDGGKGDELEHGTDGWQIDAALTPHQGETVFEKQYNSAFLDTGLVEYLNKADINHFILCGMQTEYCIDVTCKAALEHGFAVTIAQGTTTTFDNEYMMAEQCCHYLEENIWNKRYATVLPLEKVLFEIAQQQP